MTDIATSDLSGLSPELQRLVATRRQYVEARERLDPACGDILRVYGSIGRTPNAAVDGAALVRAIETADRRKRLAVIIDSGGGNVDDMERIVGAIQRRIGLTKTVGVNFVASAAAVIFCAGSLREVQPYSLLRIHFAARAHLGAVSRMTSNELRAAARHLDADDTFMSSFITQRTRQPKAEILRLMREDQLIRADRAVQLGLATYVAPVLAIPVTPSPPVARRAPTPAPAPPVRLPSPGSAAPRPRTVTLEDLMRRPLGISPAGLLALLDDQARREFLATAGNRRIFGSR